MPEAPEPVPTSTATEQPQDPPQSSKLGWRAWGHARKIAVAATTAVLIGVGVGLSGLLTSSAEKTTRQILGGSAGEPLVVDVAAPGSFFSGHAFAPYYVIPRSRVSSPRGIGKVALADSASTDEVLNYTWVVAHGGMAGSPQVVRLELWGANDDPIIVNAIVPIVVSRAPPLKGWYVANPACGGVDVRVAAFDLDKPQAPVGYVNVGGAQKQVLALSVTRTDPELIELWASTTMATIGWKAKIFYSVDGVDKDVVIDDHGHPFMVTSETQSDGYQPVFGAAGASSFRRQPAWDKVGVQAC